jgi:hypothetical protein
MLVGVIQAVLEDPGVLDTRIKLGVALEDIDQLTFAEEINPADKERALMFLP